MLLAQELLVTFAARALLAAAHPAAHKHTQALFTAVAQPACPSLGHCSELTIFLEYFLESLMGTEPCALLAPLWFKNLENYFY